MNMDADLVSLHMLTKSIYHILQSRLKKVNEFELLNKGTFSKQLSPNKLYAVVINMKFLNFIELSSFLTTTRCIRVFLLPYLLLLEDQMTRYLEIRLKQYCCRKVFQ